MRFKPASQAENLLFSGQMQKNVLEYPCFPQVRSDRIRDRPVLIFFRGHMKNQFNRQHRFNNNARSARSAASQQITRFTVLDSSGPLGKLRGTALQLAEKYQAGAKDAQTQGDVVLFQTCQQYADHYLRLQAIAIENEQPKIKSEESIDPEQNDEAEKNTLSETEDQSEKNTVPPIITEKAPIKHHKKESKDNLSMPMEALQKKTEKGE